MIAGDPPRRRERQATAVGRGSSLASGVVLILLGWLTIRSGSAGGTLWRIREDDRERGRPPCQKEGKPTYGGKTRARFGIVGQLPAPPLRAFEGSRPASPLKG